MPNPTRSWIAKYWATKPPRLLLGAVERSQSSRWGHEEDAVSSLEVSLENNRSAGIECAGEVVPSVRPPEIFRHCGQLAQSLGGRCFGCGKTLTIEDAKQFQAVPLAGQLRESQRGG
jgi:hypothetical protein